GTRPAAEPSGATTGPHRRLTGQDIRASARTARASWMRPPSTTPPASTAGPPMTPTTSVGSDQTGSDHNDSPNPISTGTHRTKVAAELSTWATMLAPSAPICAAYGLAPGSGTGYGSKVLTTADTARPAHSAPSA